MATSLARHKGCSVPLRLQNFGPRSKHPEGPINQLEKRPGAQRARSIGVEQEIPRELIFNASSLAGSEWKAVICELFSRKSHGAHVPERA